jgi:hypothetical protein
MVETFLVESWLDHLRQHERVKTADRALQDLANQFQTDGTAPAIRTSLLGSGIDGRDRVFALPSIIVLPGGIRNDDAKKVTIVVHRSRLGMKPVGEFACPRLPRINPKRVVAHQATRRFLVARTVAWSKMAARMASKSSRRTGREKNRKLWTANHRTGLRQNPSCTHVFSSQRSAAPDRAVCRPACRKAEWRGRCGAGRGGTESHGRPAHWRGVSAFAFFSHASAGLRQFYAAIWLSSAQPITRKLLRTWQSSDIEKEILLPQERDFWYRCSGPTAHLAA